MRQFLEYKCAWLGILLFFAPQFYASSRYCSHCGRYYNKDLTLDDREWVCPVCGHHHDRDYNAARNLQSYGLWLLNLVVPTNDNAVRYTVSDNSVANACPHGDAQCVTYREGMVYTSPKDMRLQFFETQEQCMAMKQEITNTYLRDKNV
jgi:putative transposase